MAGPLKSPEARQAMCYSFPYEETIQGVYNGRVRQSRGGLGEVIRGFNPDTFQYRTDLEKARELFAAAGVAAGTTLTLAVETGIEQPKIIGQLYQANRAQLDINLEIRQLDTGAMTATVYGDAPVEERLNMMAWFWWPDHNDSWNHLYPQITCESGGSAGSNAGFSCNEEVDRLMLVARDAVEEETYLDAIPEVQQIISEQDRQQSTAPRSPGTFSFVVKFRGFLSTRSTSARMTTGRCLDRPNRAFPSDTRKQVAGPPKKM